MLLTLNKHFLEFVFREGDCIELIPLFETSEHNLHSFSSICVTLWAALFGLISSLIYRIYSVGIRICFNTRMHSIFSIVLFTAEVRWYFAFGTFFFKFVPLLRIEACSPGTLNF